MLSHRAPASLLAAALMLTVVSAAVLVAQAKKDVSVRARKYTYVVSDSTGPQIRVQKGDLVSIEFSTEDIPHSFTISDDFYRIDKRADPGKPPVKITFRADQDGVFDIKCTLTIDPRCQKEMKGQLIVMKPAAR